MGNRLGLCPKTPLRDFIPQTPLSASRILSVFCTPDCMQSGTCGKSKNLRFLMGLRLCPKPR